MNIPLSGPEIGDREIELVNEVLRSGWLSLGSMMEEFEARFASYTGTQHAIAVNSGTSGLHLLVRALGIGDGDQVITTPFSFVASSNCILFERAEPVFVDIDPRTLCIDPAQVEEAVTERTRAILPVDVFGQPADMEAIMRIAGDHDLAVIEDSCEAIGAEHQGRRVGSLADGSVFGFYPNKQITTGEGGMVVTDCDRTAELCRSMRNQGRGEDGSWLDHVRLGYNYRLDEMSCALGVAQLERIDTILKRRADVAREYERLFRDVDEVRTPCIDARTTRMSWFVYVVRFRQGVDRDAVMEHLRERGVGCKVYFPPIHLQPFYRETFGYRPGDLPVTEEVSGSVLALPFFNGLGEKEIRRVVETVKEALARRNG